MELDVLTEITSVQKCYGACRVTTDCQYYVYRKDNKECKLYLPSNDYFDCDLIRGPATPQYSQVSTSKFKPNQYLDDLIFRLVVEITKGIFYVYRYFPNYRRCSIDTSLSFSLSFFEKKPKSKQCYKNKTRQSHAKLRSLLFVNETSQIHRKT